ncbi:hypothetical protein ACOI22_12730 [Glaciecola sp. 2405UD65-10]|jgi:hypothetical protein|uniref:hypothetical protein n=1 Tax=Glaciecola sp. 2405UD65-10 TaxID=3397244 RepID=UPI003B5A8DCB
MYKQKEIALKLIGLLFIFYFILSQAVFAKGIIKDNSNAKTESITAQPNHYCEHQQWLDKTYCHFFYGIDSAANTLNDWSRHEGSNLNSEASTSGRLRFGWEPRSGDFSALDFRFKIRVKLPALEERVELVLSDQEDDVNGQELKAARSEELGNNKDQAVVALQFKRSAEDKVSYRVGFGRGSQIYTRARYSDMHRLSPDSTLRYFAEANYYSEDELGTELNAEFAHVFTPKLAYELSNSFRYRNKSNDWLWRHEMQLIYMGKNNSSYLFTAMIDGLSQPNYRKEQMLLSMRYKKQVLREWLYLELEPYILYLRREDFRPSIGIALRAEVHFST